MTTFTSNINATIRAHRAARIARERAAMQLELGAYNVVAARLRPAIEALITQIEADSPTASQLQRLARYQALLEQVEAQIGLFARIVDARVTAEQAALVDLALVQTAELAEAIGIGATWNRVPREALSSLVGSLRDGSPLRTVLMRYGPEAAEQVGRAFIEGVGLGLNPRLIAGDVQKALNVPRWKALRLTRTAVLDSYRSASIEQYKANSDVVRAYRRWSALDARTCAWCRERHGRVYALDVAFEEHPSGRCTPLPVTVGMEEILRG